ncbi:TonB-dependent receptor [Aequorivita sp. H23M31]|uniref:TonB-dependent receptor n=1 Tax=Aequorivita ciconiae TaxID=2494375 RepID=A0A410FZR7_9FLAO|nr:TonB-dependent receptor [Aequorivita sp. H23M31]QAA80499.1 TonB-dependent receptor [Aequorivita sp. H23M31]
MLRNFSALFLLLFVQITLAQNTEIIRGKIINSLDEQLENITIHLVETNTVVQTDSEGKFIFKNLAPGIYNLFAVYDGFNFPVETVVVVSGSVSEVILHLGTMNYSLEEVMLQTLTVSEKLKNSAIKADVIPVEANTRRANSVEDLVNKSPGVKIRNVGGLGSASNIIVGGFSGNAVKFLYDDIPIDYMGSNFGLTKIPTNAISRVEVYKGVLPTKIGVDALGSAINIVPKTSTKTSGTVSYETGSYNTHIATANANIKLNKNLFLGINSFYNYSKNDYKVDNLPYKDPGTGQVTYIRERLFHNGFNQHSLEFSLQARELTWADLIELKVNSYGLEKDIQNDQFSRARPFGEVYRKEHGNFIPSLKYKKHFFENKLSLNQFLVYSNLDFEIFDQAKNVYYDWKGISHKTNSGSEMGNILLKNGYLHNSFEQFTSRTNLNYLINNYFQIESNTVLSLYNRKSNTGDLNPEGTDYDKVITNLALNSQFFDQKLESNTQLKYLSGHFAGQYNASDNPLENDIVDREVTNSGVSFSQALKYNINPNSYIRASYENTFRLPEQQELFGDNNFIIANYELTPEESRNINLGYTYATIKYGFEINTYYRNTQNLIRLKDLNQYQAKYLNLDNVKGLGVELQANYEPVDNLLLSGNLTWNDFRLQSSRDKYLNNQHFKDARVANMPFYYGNLSASYNLKEILKLTSDFSFFWDYSYVHQYYLDYIEKQFEPDGFLGLFGTSKINTSRIIPNQHTHNAGFIYVRDFTKQSVSFSAELKNIFDADIYNEFKMQSPGRHFRVKITFSF